MTRLARPLQTAGSSPEISYQGVLDDAGAPAEGQYDFQFFLYDAISGGGQVGNLVALEDVTVADGYFTVLLDFGDVWDGTPVYLQIEVRPGSETGGFNVLSPRQPLTAAPFAAFAARVPWGGVTEVPAGLADGDDDTTYIAGSGLTLNNNEFAAQGSPVNNLIIVAQSGGDFTAIQTAVDSIDDASSINQYLIWIAPGVYFAAAIFARADSIPFSIDWWTVDNGGGLSAGGDFSVNGTIGQFDINQQPSNGVYTVNGGFGRRH